MPKRPTKKTSGYIQSALNKLDTIEKRARLEKNDDEFENFGKYVSSSLRILHTENRVHAQNEIQANYLNINCGILNKKNDKTLLLCQNLHIRYKAVKKRGGTLRNFLCFILICV